MTKENLGLIGMAMTLVGALWIMWNQKDVFMAMMVLSLWTWTFLTGTTIQESIDKRDKEISIKIKNNKLNITKKMFIKKQLNLIKVILQKFIKILW